MIFRQLLKPRLPHGLLTWLRKKRQAWAVFDALKPLHPRTCPLCGYRGFFQHFGRPPRLDALCPSCGSVERHRQFWLWHERDENKLTEPILHFAPEPILEQKLRHLYPSYSTADLFAKADMKLDMENIALESGSYNTVIGNHVLEHVSDRIALTEIFRILSPAGRLIVSVPIIEGWAQTYENESVQDPLSRELHFGQSDHVRYYGRDFRERLRDAGFSKIIEVTAEPRDVLDYGLLRGDKFFVCCKT